MRNFVTIMACQVERVARGKGERFRMSFIKNWKKVFGFWENIPWLWPSMV